MPEGAPERAQNEQSSHSSADDENWELFKADDFRMYCMKVLPCSKRFCHDWTVCPYAHPGEKAKRRDPRVHSYTGIACPNMKKDQACVRGDSCPYAHNVFEYWLHPTRYRTQLCNDMEKCNRKICFFAHSPEEVRHPTTKPFVPPEALAAATTNATLEAVRKAAADSAASQKEAASATLVDALLKAHGGNNSQLLAQLQSVQGLSAGGDPQNSAHLVDALTALLQSCGLVQSQEARSQSRRRSFSDGIKVGQRPAVPAKDDRLDLSASGKCRSDPARMRARGAQRGRGRQSLDTVRDLKRYMTSPTINENKPCLPTIESLVSALAGSNDFMANQGAFSQDMPNCSTPFSTPEEMAAYSAGVAAAQQMMSSPEDLQQLLQAQAAAAQQQPSLQDWNANAELLNQLQHMQQTGEEQAPAWPPVYGQRRGPQAAQMPMSLHAAASLRAHAALTGEPWLGDAVSTGQQAQQGASEFEAYLASMQGDAAVWGETTSLGLAHMGSMAEGAEHMYDGRPSMDSRRSSDSNYMPGMAAQEYMPHCEPINEYMSMRSSMDANMRMSIDSMRSGVSPNQTLHGPLSMAQAAPTADYRSSSLFSHFGGSFAGTKTPPPAGEKASFGSGPSNSSQGQHYGQQGAN